MRPLWLMRLLGKDRPSCGCPSCRAGRRSEGPVTLRFRKTLLTEPAGEERTDRPVQGTAQVRAITIARCTGCNLPYEEALLLSCPDCRGRYCPYCDRQYHACGMMRRPGAPAPTLRRGERARLAA
jgi:hypothetical protein